MNEVKSPKKPLIYYYMIVVLLVLLFNLLAMPWLAEHQIKEVDYNTFVSMTEKNADHADEHHGQGGHPRRKMKHKCTSVKPSGSESGRLQ